MPYLLGSPGRKLLYQRRRRARNTQKVGRSGYRHLEFSLVPFQHSRTDESADGPHRGNGSPLYGAKAQRAGQHEQADARASKSKTGAKNHPAVQLRLVRLGCRLRTDCSPI